MFTCDKPYVEKFHGCNARVVSWFDPMNSIYTWELVSYETSVCRLKFRTEHACSSRPTGELISVAFGRYAKCSATTWRQVCRFVNEYCPYGCERYCPCSCEHYFERLFKGYKAYEHGLLIYYPSLAVKLVDWPWGSFGGFGKGCDL